MHFNYVLLVNKLVDVNGCHGVCIGNCNCLCRCWVVVDEKGQFLTQKKHPTMARIAQQLEIDAHGQAVVTLTVPDLPELKLTSHFPDMAERTQVKYDLLCILYTNYILDRKPADRQIERHTNNQIDNHMDRQTHRQTYFRLVSYVSPSTSAALG